MREGTGQARPVPAREVPGVRERARCRGRIGGTAEEQRRIRDRRVGEPVVHPGARMGRRRQRLPGQVLVDPRARVGGRAGDGRATPEDDRVVVHRVVDHARPEPRRGGSRDGQLRPVPGEELPRVRIGRGRPRIRPSEHEDVPVPGIVRHQRAPTGQGSLVRGSGQIRPGSVDERPRLVVRHRRRVRVPAEQDRIAVRGIPGEAGEVAGRGSAGGELGPLSARERPSVRERDGRRRPAEQNHVMVDRVVDHHRQVPRRGRGPHVRTDVGPRFRIDRGARGAGGRGRARRRARFPEEIRGLAGQVRRRLQDRLGHHAARIVARRVSGVRRRGGGEWRETSR